MCSGKALQGLFDKIAELERSIAEKLAGAPADTGPKEVNLDGTRLNDLEKRLRMKADKSELADLESKPFKSHL